MTIDVLQMAHFATFTLDFFALKDTYDSWPSSTTEGLCCSSRPGRMILKLVATSDFKEIDVISMTQT